MRKRSAYMLGVILCLGAVAGAMGQFSSQQLAQREQWEEFLSTAEIVKSERIGQGVTKPWKLYLKKGDVEASAAWKDVHQNLGGGALDHWRFEIAAYRIDKLIGLNMVPPAVEREFRGKQGGLSLWAESQYNLVQIMERNLKVPKSTQKYIEDMGYVYRLWSCLIANDDPTQENVRYTKDWKMILIDHSRAFRSDKKYTTRLVFGTKGIKKHLADGKPYLIRRAPRALLERIEALDQAGIKQAVGTYLTDVEIESVVARIKLIHDEIAEMIKQFGEDNVLY
jgi:hypothetical protein